MVFLNFFSYSFGIIGEMKNCLFLLGLEWRFVFMSNAIFLYKYPVVIESNIVSILNLTS